MHYISTRNDDHAVTHAVTLGEAIHDTQLCVVDDSGLAVPMGGLYLCLCAGRVIRQGSVARYTNDSRCDRNGIGSMRRKDQCDAEI